MSRRIPIFIVSLEGSSQRRNSVSAQMAKLNLEFEFFDAVNGKALNPQELGKLYDEARALQTCHRKLTRGEIGCTLSHLFLYRKMALEGIEWALILEDDVVLGEHFLEFYQFLNDTPDLGLEDSFLMLGGQEGLLNYDWWLITSIFGVKKASAHTKLRRCTRSSKYVARSCSYFIPLTVAERIYQAGLPVHLPIDHWYYFMRKNCFRDMYVVDPWVVEHPIELGGQSILETERAHSVDQKKEGTLKQGFKTKVPFVFNALKNLKHLARQALRLIP
jgi:beta-1,4-galactosyltransferase